MSATKPICERCWVEKTTAFIGGAGVVKRPVRVLPDRESNPNDDPEECHFCTRPTWAGIFTRCACGAERHVEKTGKLQP